MAVKTATVEQQAAEAEAKAAELRRKADAAQAEREHLEATRQAERDRLEAEWWTSVAPGLLGPMLDKARKAWETFETAVRDGQPAVAEWTAYKIAWRAADAHRVAVNHHRRGVASAHALRQYETFTALRVEARLLGNPKYINEVGEAEYNRRLTRWHEAAAAYAGPGNYAPSRGGSDLPQVYDPRMTNPLPSEGSAEDPRGDSYARAVDHVVSQLVAEATAQATDARQAALDTWVDGRLP